MSIAHDSLLPFGFGNSFASVPILAPIYIPLAFALGLSPLAMLGAASALGNAGSPASTITIGATAVMNADGQHDHIKDSVMPIFSTTILLCCFLRGWRWHDCWGRLVFKNL